MICRLIYLFFCLLGLADWAHASSLSPDPVSPSDFAYGAKITAPPGNALYECVVPQWVYEKTTRTDLGDIRIFNASGEPVPHMVRNVQAGSSDPSPPSRPLPFFPLASPQESGKDNLSLQIRTDETGAILHVGTPPPSSEEKITTCIIDCSKVSPRPCKLILEWEKKDKDFVASLKVFSSDALDRWDHLIASDTITDLSFSRHHLKKNDIVFTRPAGTYLKLVWINTPPPMNLTGVKGVFPSEERPITRDWKRLTATRPIKNDNAPEIIVETGGFMPVDRVKIFMKEINTVMDVEILQSAAPPSEWRPICQGVLYRLVLDHIPVINDTLSFPPAYRPSLKFEITSGGQAMTTDNLSIEIGWIPQNIVFVAGGKGPFTLACGNSAPIPQAAPMTPLLDSLDRQFRSGFIQRAELGPPIILGGESKRIRRKPPLPVKTFILVFILLSGVGSIGLMTLRLYRQMKKDQRP